MPPPAAPETPPVIEVQPQISPMPESVTPAPAVGPEPAPTIQVTIGRVEVRATPAPATSRKPATEPAVMSLEEYLRQRSAGGER
jgi:hypothetical protein